MFITNDNATPPLFKYVLSEDQEEYGRWGAPYLEKFFPRQPPALYNYTSGNGLIEIIKSGELWSTQVNCLNDASEFLYTLARLQDRAETLLPSAETPEVKFLLETIIAELKRHLPGVLPWFVACFTEDGDDLSQWRGYGGGEGGYSIEFDSVYLRGMSHPGQVLLGKIEYDEVKQNAFLDDLLKRTISFFLDGIKKQRAPTREEWANDFLACWSWYNALFAPMIKHPKFKEEREWRLLYPLNDEAIPRMRYLQRSSMLTKHVPIRLMTQDGKPRLPLKSVIVGPCRHVDISKISVGDRLRTYEYSTPVFTTEIPYQAI
jgi:Protein of unknown function (DUF2971)